MDAHVFTPGLPRGSSKGRAACPEQRLLFGPDSIGYAREGLSEDDGARRRYASSNPSIFNWRV